MSPLLLVTHAYTLKYYVQMKLYDIWDLCLNNPTEGSSERGIDGGGDEISLAMSW